MAFAPLLNHHAAFCCKAASPQQSRPAALPLLWRSSRHALLTQAATVLSPGAAGGAVLRSLGEQSSNAVPLGNTLSRSERSSGVEDVTTVHSAADFQDILRAHPDQLVVLMCKAMSCRPCKMFTRKFERLAASYSDAVFCEILGDENNDTRRMMMELQVKVTPTFMLFRGRTEAGEPARVHSLTGISEANLRRAVLDHLQPGEAGAEASEEDAGPATEGAPPTAV